MHDIRFIRENPAAFDAGLKKRNLAPLSAELVEIDRRRRAAISESEAAQARRKALSRQIGQAKAKGEPADALMAEVEGLDATLGSAIIAEGLLNYFDTPTVQGMWARFASVLQRFPNGLHLSDLQTSVQAERGGPHYGYRQTIPVGGTAD